MSKRKRTSEIEQWIKQGRTEGILMDWGTLPCLAIQHYYTDGLLQLVKFLKVYKKSI